MPTFQPKFATSKPEKAGPHITAGVGEGARSTPHDTALVQAMLKGVTQKYYSGRIDGKVGPKTLAAIRGFQASHVKVQSNDRPGVFDPRGMGVGTLAQMYAKHIVVIEGTTSPYLVPVGRHAKVRGGIAQLDWAEPTFRKDLEAFALALRGETSIGLSFRPLPSVPHPACETAAEAVFADFSWINQEGWDVRAQGHALTGFSGAQQLERALHAFARQFELFFKVAGKTWPLTLEQSPVRWQERVRKSPLLNSVWVENPVDKQELILVDPKTGRVRSLTQNQGPMRLRKGLALSSFRTDPPCGLPKPEAYRGVANPVLVEFPDPGKFIPLCAKGQALRTQSPYAMKLTLADAGILGLIDPNNIDPVADFCDGGGAAEAARKFARAFNAPTIKRLANALIAADKKLRIETGVPAGEMARTIEQALKTAANADLSDGDPTEDLVNQVRDTLFGHGSEDEFRRAVATILSNRIPVDKIQVISLDPDLLKVMITGSSISFIDHATPGVSLLNPRLFVLERRPPLRLRPLANIAETMLGLVALSPAEQNEPLNLFARGLGEIAADLLLSRFPAIALPLIILESFATTDNSEDFFVTLGTKSAGLVAGKYVRGRTGIDRHMGQAVRDPRLKLSTGAGNLISTFTGQTLETSVDLGVQRVARNLTGYSSPTANLRLSI